MIRVDYKSELTQQLAFALFTLNKANEVFNVLKPVPRARDVGIPELGDTPLTQDLATKYRQYQNASTPNDIRSLADSVIEFISGYFKVTFELISEIPTRAENEVERIENHIEKPIVIQRDYRINPKCAQIVFALATRLEKKCTLQDLQHSFPTLYDEIPDIIDYITNKWKGLIEYDPNTQIISLNDSDYRDILALVAHEPIEPNHRLAKLIEKNNKNMGALYFILEKVAPPEFKSYILKQENKYFNLSLKEFPTLFTALQVKELNTKKLCTALDFLECDYSFLKYQTKMTKAEIIEAKTRLASKMKYDCKDFEIDLIHPSILMDQQIKSISYAVRDLKAYFKNDNLTYQDILAQDEILLQPDDAITRRICYRIIAFIRDYHEKCMEADFEDFKPYPKNWNYTSHLKPKELRSLNIKKDDILKSINIDKQTQKPNTILTQDNISSDQSGLSDNHKKEDEINSEISSENEIKEGKDEE
jgi:hypothetical protein